MKTDSLFSRLEYTEDQLGAHVVLKAYRIHLKYSDRRVGANSIDLDQTPQNKDDFYVCLNDSQIFHAFSMHFQQKIAFWLSDKFKELTFLDCRNSCT